MMVREHYSLREWNTFGTEATARWFAEFSRHSELAGFLREHPGMYRQILVVGGGSNLLFTADYPGLVLHPAMKGMTVEREDGEHAWVRAGAGEVWDDFVSYAVNAGWGGVENLSLIPGCVGAVPVQNIGAYGREAGEVIDSVRGVDLVTGEIWELSGAECWFGYRSSIFKQELAGRFVVTSVVFRLDKHPRLQLTYGELASLAGHDRQPSLAEVRETVIAVRRKKLPDPAVLGNAGSFFKNPVVEEEWAARMKGLWPQMPLYPAVEGHAKLSAGWLIDQCGWKGFRRGDAGVHEHHALVLVNHGHATGREIFDLSQEIRFSVKEKFGIDLEREVQAVGRMD
ncbi:MAG TPA: UDP-N-acetylmuramate dehydrogenase [Prolixibacteraceae bacterium]|nr:UDP-N-acetylmuramate dehydrogenase [Prolixibacteraceae bacterium]